MCVLYISQLGSAELSLWIFKVAKAECSRELLFVMMQTDFQQNEKLLSWSVLVIKHRSHVCVLVCVGGWFQTFDRSKNKTGCHSPVLQRCIWGKENK